MINTVYGTFKDTAELLEHFKAQKIADIEALEY